MEEEGVAAVETKAEDEENNNGITEVESLCMNCHDNVRLWKVNNINAALIQSSGNYEA